METNQEIKEIEQIFKKKKLLIIEDDDDEITNTKSKKIITEDLGKMFEMAICLALEIQYDGPYKYGMEIPEKLKERLREKLSELLPHKMKHTAKRGARYDYTSIIDDTIHLSAKTTKRGIGKVAPQVIGQSQPKKFCEIIGIEFIDIINLKQYIQENIIKILPFMINYTFDCPNIYYNLDKDKIRYITKKNDIDWNKYNYKWTCSWDNWNNSSSVKIILDDGTEFALAEFQIHSKNRTNMAIRWCYDNILIYFKDNFNVIDI